jgi:hypothetical protein
MSDKPDQRQKTGPVYPARLPPRWAFQKGAKLGEIIQFDDLRERRQRRQTWRETQIAMARGGGDDAA